MHKKEIIKDIERIIKIQKLNIEKLSNSLIYIFEDSDFNYDLSYDIDDFKKKCRWKDIKIEISSDSKAKEGFNELFELSESFIDTFSEDMGWYLISKNINLSEHYIEKNSEKLNWQMICQFQNLSENFIERNLDKISWFKLSLGQKRLSEEFILKYIHKLNINNVIIFNKVISENFKERIKEYRWI
jgi:hypothetical protein